MATKKAFIKLDLDIIVPITRGEVVLDSKGEEAFHSYEFVASNIKPGLFTPEEKAVVEKSVIISLEIPESKIVQVLKIDKNNTINIFPKTKAEAVSITIGEKTTTLDIVVLDMLDLDNYPTKDSTKGVTSGGVWLHVDDVVGVLHRESIKI